MEYLLGTTAAVAILSALSWRFEDKGATTFGSAKWCSVWTLFKQKLFTKKGLHIGDYKGRLGVYYDGAHAVTFGATGAGKGTTAIIPNLLRAKNIFLIDPGGENTAVAIRKWRKDGKAVSCLNIFGMFGGKPWALPAHGFNPLDVLDEKSASFAADAQVLAEMLTARSGQESGSNAYFTDQAEALKKALLLHIKTTEPAERQNLVTFYNMVNSDADEWDALIAAMQENKACGGEIIKRALIMQRIEVQSAGEFSAIMSTVQRNVSWLSDELVQKKLCRSDVDFASLKQANKNGAVISIVLPLQYLESHAAILRLAMGCAILELQRAPYASENVLFLIDECAALGKIKRFPNWLATLRKYKVGIWSIWQNVGQLVDLYGKNWQTIIGNCGLKQILSVGDLETAQYVENLLGKATVKAYSTGGKGQVSTSYTTRPLMMADELLRMKNSRQIAFIDNLAPIVLKKTGYWKRPENAGAFHRNPFLKGKSSKASLSDHIMELWGQIFYALVWWFYPHPLAACIMLAPIIWFVLAVIKAAGA